MSPGGQEYQERDNVKIAGDSGARTSCAGCDDEAVYTIGWLERGMANGTMCRVGEIRTGATRGRVFRRPNEFPPDGAMHSVHEGGERVSTRSFPLDPIPPSLFFPFVIPFCDCTHSPMVLWIQVGSFVAVNFAGNAQMECCRLGFKKKSANAQCIDTSKLSLLLVKRRIS